MRLHPIPLLSEGEVGDGVWKHGSSYSLHAVWLGVSLSVCRVPSCFSHHDILQFTKIFGHLPMSITSSCGVLLKWSNSGAGVGLAATTKGWFNMHIAHMLHARRWHAPRWNCRLNVPNCVVLCVGTSVMWETILRVCVWSASVLTWNGLKFVVCKTRLKR